MESSFMAPQAAQKNDNNLEKVHAFYGHVLLIDKLTD